MSEFRSAKRRVNVSVGESVRIIRELQDLSQNHLAQLTGIPAVFVRKQRKDYRHACLGKCMWSRMPRRGCARTPQSRNGHSSPMSAAKCERRFRLP